MLVGITPGWTQMQLAFETARDALPVGLSHEDVFRAVEQTEDGRGGFRTCDLSRVKRALSH